MKTWVIDYSIKKKDGTIQETGFCADGDLEKPTIKASDIFQAARMAKANILDPLTLDPEVEKAVIYGISIVEDDVF